MDDVRSGKIECIVVKDLSRFGRDYLETGYYIDPNTNELLDPETGNPVGTNYDPIPSE